VVQRDYNGWEQLFLPEFQKKYFCDLKEFLQTEYKTKDILPRAENILRAFDLVSPSEIKVVILGQDPYPTVGHPVGLAFSVTKYVSPLPPSLLNIFNEIKRDIGKLELNDGDLTPWARQGVLLLNTVLTVEAKKPNSHRNHGWEHFTDAAISYIDRLEQPIVFMLWGNNAIEKKRLLTNPSHIVLTTSHPSPLSAYQGFNGCGHFCQANEYLERCGRTPIRW